ncbi:MAG: outer membrane protein assembly factor BamB, partial [Gammaproteobacteria bacterium]|nr:outer membrane protein assembly factor BamB [Gammaproteobacteria bacterium]
SNEYGDGNRILRIKAEGNTLTVLDDEGVITRYEVTPSALSQFKAEHEDDASFWSFW